MAFPSSCCFVSGMWPQIPGFYPTRQPQLKGICLPLQPLAPLLAGIMFSLSSQGCCSLVSYSTALAAKGVSAFSSSCTSPGQLPRLRPLYQYINLDMTELMHPSPEDEVPELAQPSQVPAASNRATAPQLEGELQQGLPSSCIPQGTGLVLPVTCWSP